MSTTSLSETIHPAIRLFGSRYREVKPIFECTFQFHPGITELTPMDLCQIFNRMDEAMGEPYSSVRSEMERVSGGFIIRRYYLLRAPDYIRN